MLSLGAIPGALIRWHLNNDLLVNVIGAALLGFFFGAKLSKKCYLMMGIGFCGSMTTFSALMGDLLFLALENNFLGLFWVIISHTSLALIFAFLGLYLGKKLVG